MSAAALWDKLRQAALVEGELPAATETDSPWYIRTMLGIAGWIGAMFLLGFVGVGLAFVIKSALASLVFGAIACAVAAALFRARPESDFFGQFAFAVSLAGQVLLMIGLSEFFGRERVGISLTVAIVEAVLFFLIPNFVHRVWCAGVGLGGLMFALDGLGFQPYTRALVLAACATAWLQEFQRPGRGALLRAFGYGSVLLIVFMLVSGSAASMGGALWGYPNVEPVGGALGYRIGAALSGIVLLWVVMKLLRRYGKPAANGPGLLALAGALVVGLVSLKAPGIAITLTILLLGFANGNRVLAGLGIAGLLAYLSWFYYSLHATLLEKSALLFCAGVALLLARLAVRQRSMKEPRRA